MTLLVGRVARAHGNKGQVIVNPETDFPVDRFAPGSVLLVEQGGRTDERRIGAVRFQDGRPIIALDGIETMSAAEALSGAELKVRQADLPPLAAGTFYRHDLVGCEVATAAGVPVGRVTRVEGPIERSLLVAATRRGEAMIPMVDAIVKRVDLAAKRIVIDAPEGLLDLNEDRQRD